ncbi:hypothetical protein PR202_ga06974 [Eleusine coracana subsp. coracana]|uniref:Uncharacterized protein n=1 Tax=Eleusine coracana subsp. coracana TaxID=191504 RepID=A0AAV5BYR7_ELECO|nr:hypothetical protein PR202_ga06974 [Eleusine coracana subsp. coracana]
MIALLVLVFLSGFTPIDFGTMDPEDFSDSEEELEDDDVMLFILPALYLASTEIASPVCASTGTATPRTASKRIAAPGRTSKISATPGHASTGTASPDDASERIATPANTSNRKRTAKRRHVAKEDSPADKKKFRTVEWVCKMLEGDRGEGYDKLQVKPQFQGVSKIVGVHATEVQMILSGVNQILIPDAKMC